ARDGQCPRLGRELAEKERFHRERICTEDRAHWREAMTGPVDAMDSVASTLRCKQVADDAQKELQQRKKQEAAVADMKSAAVDLGTLTNGSTVERPTAVGGAVAVGLWKVQLTEADFLEAQFDDLNVSANASVTINLLDASWNIVDIRLARSAP